MRPSCIIVSGTRRVPITWYPLIFWCIDDTKLDIVELVSGHAKGVDRLGEWYARDRDIPVKVFPITDEDWTKYGKSAGRRRNRAMYEHALKSEAKPAIIAIWDGASRGTAHMISLGINDERIQTFVYLIRSPDRGRFRAYRASDDVVRELLGVVLS